MHFHVSIPKMVRLKEVYMHGQIVSHFRFNSKNGAIKSKDHSADCDSIGVSIPKMVRLKAVGHNPHSVSLVVSIPKMVRLKANRFAQRS